MDTNQPRCSWVPLDKPDYVAYHDTQWGRPVHDDRELFEMLILEGAQAGLSWYTILQRRDAYRQAFHNFNVVKVAHMTDTDLEHVLTESGVIRNQRKVRATRTNAKIFLAIQKECGSLITTSGHLSTTSRSSLDPYLPNMSPPARRYLDKYRMISKHEGCLLSVRPSSTPTCRQSAS